MTDEKSPPDREKQTGSEYGDALADVLDDQHQRSERRKTSPHPTRRRLSPLAAPALAGISFWLWIWPPPALEPTPPPEVPVVVQEAGLRIEMYLHLAQIQKFMKDNGRLPTSLQETQEGILAGVEYIPMPDSTFRLRGIVGGVTIDYISTQPVEELLQDAQQVVTTQARGG